VKSSLLPLAIKLSLPCSAFELVSYINNTGVGQGHPLGYITINFGGQEVKDQGHATSVIFGSVVDASFSTLQSSRFLVATAAAICTTGKNS